MDLEALAKARCRCAYGRPSLVCSHMIDGSLRFAFWCEQCQLTTAMHRTANDAAEAWRALITHTNSS